jgi:hypothetical protein
MIKNGSKLTLYTSNDIWHPKKAQSVRSATKKTAETLNLEFKEAHKSNANLPIYVYFEDEHNDAVPLYCDEGKNAELDEISSKIRSMMYVLSFHPKHATLAQIRSRLVKFS